MEMEKGDWPAAVDKSTPCGGGVGGWVVLGGRRKNKKEGGKRNRGRNRANKKITEASFFI
jgi:hypothetical protein